VPYHEDQVLEHEGDQKSKRRVNRLTRIEPPIVSVVRRGANRGRFVLKNEEGTMPEDQKVDEFGNPIIDLDSPETEPADDTEKANAARGPGGQGLGPGGKCVCPKCGAEVDHKTGEGCVEMECPKCGAKMSRPATEKADMMPPGVKSKVSEVLTSVLERSKSLLAKVNAVGTDEKAQKPIPSAIEQELRAISAALSGVMEKYPTPQSAQAGNAKPPEKDEKSEMERAAETVGKAADTGSMSKKDVRAFRKLFVSMRKLLEQIDPDAKSAMKGLGIVLKSDGSEPQDDAVTAKIEALEARVAEQAEAIAKWERTVPEGNSASFASEAPDPEPVVNDFVFGYEPKSKEEKE
jgi:hypothetical protein